MTNISSALSDDSSVEDDVVALGFMKERAAPRGKTPGARLRPGGETKRSNAGSEFLKLLAHPPPEVPKAPKGSLTLSFWGILGRVSVQI